MFIQLYQACLISLLNAIPFRNSNSAIFHVYCTYISAQECTRYSCLAVSLEAVEVCLFWYGELALFLWCVQARDREMCAYGIVKVLSIVAVDLVLYCES
jgi:hypothetical protein